MLTTYEAAELLLAINAVTFRPASPFKYESGFFSPIYVDCRLLSSYPDQRSLVADSLVEQFRATGLAADVVVGTGVSAIPLTEGVARRLGLPMAYVRRTHKSHGLGKQIEGTSVEGQQVLLISDIISTSEDIPSSVRSVREAGGRITRCQAVFDMQLQENDRFLAGENIPYGSLSKLSDLLVVAEVKKHLTRSDRLLVEEWHRSPSEWDRMRSERLSEARRRNKRLVSETLVRTNAVRIRADPPFVYSAGGTGPIYTDIRILLAHPRERETILKTLADVVVQEIGIQNIDCVAAVATGGIPYATGLADGLSLPLVIVRATAGESDRRIEGALKQGDRALLLEDLVNRGQSMLAAAAVLRNAGATVTACMAVLSYGLGRTSAALAEAGLRMTALSDLDTLLSVSVENRVITAEEQQIVQGWAGAPDDWASRPG